MHRHFACRWQSRSGSECRHFRKCPPPTGRGLHRPPRARLRAALGMAALPELPSAPSGHSVDMKSRLTRRHFLQTATRSALAAPFVTSALRGAAPNAKLQHASVGAGGQAAADLGAFMAHPSFHLVAVADVDRRNLDTFKAA